MGRDRVLWTAAAVWAVLLTAGRAAPQLDTQHLKAEHRGSSIDISAKLPAASDDMFIWNAPDGSYKFGMQGRDQWRVESRDSAGNVNGRYVYRTPEGQIVDVSYDSGPQGYRAKGDAIPGGVAPMVQEEEKEEDQRTEDESPDSNSLPETAYGAVSTVGEKQKFPAGNGVTTYTDDLNKAVITDVQPTSKYKIPVVVFPVLNIPGTVDNFVGPPLVDDEPLQQASILI